MIRILIFAVLIVAAFPANAQECDTELAKTDTYKELSLKLKCLKDKIASLELEVRKKPGQQQASSGQIFRAGECLSHTREEKFSASIMISIEENQRKPVMLCWKDGGTFAKVLAIGEDAIDLRDSGGGYIAINGGRATRCPYGRKCEVGSEVGGSITVVAEKMVAADNKNVARLSISNAPN